MSQVIKTSPEPPTSKPSPLRILLVDDEDLGRARLRRMLEKQTSPIEIVGEACDGKTALELCRLLHPQVLFLDIQMPAPNGLEVAAQLVHEFDPPLLIFLTAFEENLTQTQPLNTFDYLHKPLRMERLEVTLTRLQDQIASGRERGARPSAIAC